MLKQFLYWIVAVIARFHEEFLKLNNRFDLSLTDKQLHFLVIGLLGMGIFFVVHPIFRALARRGHEIVISWVYTFTVIVVITFAIEIGQKITHTGSMEFSDIVFGVVGFLLMFAVFAVIREIFLWVKKRFFRK